MVESKILKVEELALSNFSNSNNGIKVCKGTETQACMCIFVFYGSPSPKIKSTQIRKIFAYV